MARCLAANRLSILIILKPQLHYFSSEAGIMACVPSRPSCAWQWGAGHSPGGAGRGDLNPRAVHLPAALVDKIYLPSTSLSATLRTFCLNQQLLSYINSCIFSFDTIINVHSMAAVHTVETHRRRSKGNFPLTLLHRL